MCFFCLIFVKYSTKQSFNIMLNHINQSVKHLKVLLLILSFYGHFASSQTLINPNKIIFWGINALHTTTNSYHYSKIKTNPSTSFKIKSLDSKVPLRLSKGVAKASDITFITTAFVAGIFVLSEIPKDKRVRQSIRMAENVWMTYNITETFKNTVKRVRPYAYQGVREKDDIRSFISGHSSLTANMATTLWMSNPKNKIFPILATGLAIGTAALRVKAGKHFVSDVLSGIIVGFSVAYIHEKITPINGI